MLLSTLLVSSFLPVFCEEDKTNILFRRRAQAAGDYYSIRKLGWEGTTLSLRQVKGALLNHTPDDIIVAMEAGKLLVGQTQLWDEKSGRTAIIEYPIKTINWHRDRKVWQIDTGPILLPDLTLPPEKWSQNLKLAYIAFRSDLDDPSKGPTDWADFVVEQPTDVTDGNKEKVTQVYHYSGVIHKRAQNVLLTHD